MPTKRSDPLILVRIQLVQLVSKQTLVTVDGATPSAQLVQFRESSQTLAD